MTARGAATRLALGAGAGAVTATALVLRRSSVAAYDQPTFHVLNHLPVVAFAGTMAVAAGIARRGTRSGTRVRVVVTGLTAVMTWIAAAQGIETIAAWRSATSFDPGADHAWLHQLGIGLTFLSPMALLAAIVGTARAMKEPR